MQPNKTKLALQMGTVILGAVCASNVLAKSFNATINTIDDVTIATLGTNNLDFGTSILADAGGDCSMNAATPDPTRVFSDATGVTETNWGALTATGTTACVGTTGQPGIYVISGEPTLDVTITLIEEAQAADFTFAPTGGCGVLHNGTAAGDTCIPIGTTAEILKLAGGADDEPATTHGQTHFTVGGTITVGPGGLLSDTDYIPTFRVNVIY